MSLSNRETKLIVRTVVGIALVAVGVMTFAQFVIVNDQINYVHSRFDYVHDRITRTAGDASNDMEWRDDRMDRFDERLRSVEVTAGRLDQCLEALQQALRSQASAQEPAPSAVCE